MLKIKTGKVPIFAAILLGLFFVPMGLWFLFLAITDFRMLNLVLGIALPALFGGIVLINLRAHFKSVKYFSNDGIMRNDGRNFAWSELHRVITQTRINRQTGIGKTIWRTEIHFINGESAWLIPAKISNSEEIFNYVNSLPCEHTEVSV